MDRARFASSGRGSPLGSPGDRRSAGSLLGGVPGSEKRLDQRQGAWSPIRRRTRPAKAVLSISSKHVLRSASNPGTSSCWVTRSPKRCEDEPRLATCVLLIDPWGEISVDSETVMKVLGLRRAQRQVVASPVRGMTVRARGVHGPLPGEVAEETQHTSGSVSLHVKRALEKTGARR